MESAPQSPGIFKNRKKKGWEANRKESVCGVEIVPRCGMCVQAVAVWSDVGRGVDQALPTSLHTATQASTAISESVSDALPAPALGLMPVPSTWRWTHPSPPPRRILPPKLLAVNEVVDDDEHVGLCSPRLRQAITREAGPHWRC